jgi:hypothetical protein
MPRCPHLEVEKGVVRVVCAAEENTGAQAFGDAPLVVRACCDARLRSARRLMQKSITYTGAGAQLSREEERTYVPPAHNTSAFRCGQRGWALDRRLPVRLFPFFVYTPYFSHLRTPHHTWHTEKRKGVRRRLPVRPLFLFLMRHCGSTIAHCFWPVASASYARMEERRPHTRAASSLAS